MPNMEPCPFCQNTVLSIETPANETRARGCCYVCGAKGPMSSGTHDPRPWDLAAVQDWNAWVLGRRTLGL